MQTQGWRRLADIALVVSKRSGNEGLLELAYGFLIEDATPVHLYHQRFQALLHGEPRLLEVHRFRAQSKSNSSELEAQKALGCGNLEEILANGCAHNGVELVFAAPMLGVDSFWFSVTITRVDG